jgi:hypothetical protein
MRYNILKEIIKKQKENGNKHSVYAIGRNENVCNVYKRELYAHKVWPVLPTNDDCFRVAGLCINTIYVDEESVLDEKTMEYLFTRVRKPEGDVLTIIK